jgi:hypothetical protein
MRNRFWLGLVAGLMLAAGAAFGQASTKSLTFDVASVRPSAPLDIAKLAA